MKRLILIALTVITTAAAAQKMPHGMLFGRKPGRTGLIQATRLVSYMGNRTRINATIMGRITLITKNKGGWFDMDAGNGQIITAHFRNAGINLPASLKNHSVIIEGIAQKQIVPDDHQHFAGRGSDKVPAKRGPKTLLLFEVTGLEIE